MNNNEERDAQRIMMRTGRALKTMLWINNPGVMLLITLCKQLMEEKMIKKGEFADIEKFMKVTKGDYTLVNIPLDESKGKLSAKDLEATFRNNLEAAGITFCKMPDLNKSDGYVQIAIANQDRDKFGAVFERHLNSLLHGGKKDAASLDRLTEGKVSILSIPFEGKESELLGDLEQLKINYALLPDLRVGDGEIQLYVANADLQKVNMWFELYQKDQLAKGNKIPDMKVMDRQQYQATGTMSEEQYVETADEQTRATTEKYQGQAPGAVEKAVFSQNNQPKNQEDPKYLEYLNNPDYVRLSVDKRTLVDKHYDSESFEKALAGGMFTSKVPGTGGKEKLTLVVPTSQVFQANAGNTFIVFLKKDETPKIIDAGGNMVEMTGRELDEKYYMLLDRNVSKVSSLEVSPDQFKQQAPDRGKDKAQERGQTGRRDRFNNFEGRDYDMPDLEEKLLNASQLSVPPKERIPSPPIKAKI